MFCILFIILNYIELVLVSGESCRAVAQLSGSSVLTNNTANHANHRTDSFYLLLSFTKTPRHGAFVNIVLVNLSRTLTIALECCIRLFSSSKKGWCSLETRPPSCPGSLSKGPFASTFPVAGKTGACLTVWQQSFFFSLEIYLFTFCI